MTYEEFQHLARLYAIRALEDDELREFRTARAFFGERAERYIAECRRINDALALRLRPLPPDPATRERILRMAEGGSPR